MLSRLVSGLLVVGACVFGLLAAAYTGFGLGGADIALDETVTFWAVAAVCLAFTWRRDNRIAYMVLAAGSAITAIVVLLSTPPDATAVLSGFGTASGAVALVSTFVLVRANRRAKAQTNPLRDLAPTDSTIFETDGVQYLVHIANDRSASTVQVVVYLQNCVDTQAEVRVRLEEEVVHDPSIELPPDTTASLDAEGWCVVQLDCPIQPGHRGEAWIHASVAVRRASTGRRTLLWNAEPGPGTLKVEQTSRAVLDSRGRQYLGLRVPLWNPGSTNGIAGSVVERLSADLLAKHLRELEDRRATNSPGGSDPNQNEAVLWSAP